jgi:hypothetical protein
LDIIELEPSGLKIPGDSNALGVMSGIADQSILLIFPWRNFGISHKLTRHFVEKITGLAAEESA